MAGKATLVINSDTNDGKKAIESLIKEMNKLKEENKNLREENKKAAAEAKQQYEEKLAAIRKERDEQKKLAADKKEQERIEAEANRKALQAAKEKEKLEREAADAAKKNADQHKQDLEAQDAGLARVGAGLMTVLGTYVSLNAVLNAVAENYERQFEMQQRIAQQNATVGASQIDAALSMLGASDETKGAAFRRIGSINESTGFGNVGALNKAFSASLTASGGNIEASLNAVETAAAISGGREDLIEPYASAALGISLRTGRSTDESLGAVLKAGELGGVKNPDKQARLYRSVAASGAAIDRTGNTAEAARQSMAIAATASSIVGDETGESTATFTGSLEARLAEFFQGRTGAPADSMGRIAALQKDPALFKQFDDKYNFEVKFDAVANRILSDPNYQGSQMLRSNNAQLGYDAANYRAQVQSTKTATPELRALARQNKARAAAESSMASNPNAGALAEIESLRQQAYDIVAPISSAPNVMFSTVGAIPRVLSKLGGEQMQAKALIAETQDIRDYIESYEGIGVGGAPMSQAREQLDKLIALQQESLAEMKRNTAAQTKPAVRPQGMQEAN